MKGICKLLVAFACVAAAAPSRAQVPQYQVPQVAPNDTLAGVHYDYKWELYGGPAYSHFDAGPHLVQGANLGGLDVQAARFFTHRWAAAANVRGYLGTSGVEANPYGINGPFVSEYMFLAGPEFRGPSNKHASMTLHALFGGAYGDFQYATSALTTTEVTQGLGLFNNQMTFGSAIGGSIDLNRSPRLAFRISPDAILTHFSDAEGGNLKDQFALSVGVVYRLGGPHKGKARK